MHVSKAFSGLLICFALAAGSVRAQGTSDGSIYSRFGLGELRSFSSSQIQGVGGGGTAVAATYYTNFSNPASWADQYLTRASIGMQYQGVVATDASDETSTLTSGALNAVQFSFPLYTRKLGVGVAFEPYTRSNYRVQVLGRISQTSSPADTAAYTINYEGRGGLQQVTAGAGYRLNDNINIGLSADFIFGVLEDVRRTSFFGPSYLRTRISNATRLSGVTATLGGLVSLPKVLGESDMLNLGLSFTLPTTLSGNRVRVLGESLDLDTLGGTLHGSISIPYSLRMGLSYVPDARWTFVADGRYEPWSGFESDYVFAGYTPGGESFFHDRVRASGGVEFMPSGRRVVAPFLARIAYRLGGYYDRSYVSPAEGIELATKALTAGLSLPSFFPGTRLDINFEVGTRGSTDQNLVQDTFYRVSANVNIGERWFEKRKLR